LEFRFVLSFFLKKYMCLCLCLSTQNIFSRYYSCTTWLLTEQAVVWFLHVFMPSGIHVHAVEPPRLLCQFPLPSYLLISILQIWPLPWSIPV
jgi:hypothetical protein